MTSRWLLPHYCYGSMMIHININMDAVPQGFLIDTEGHAVLARQWPSLGPRLRRVKLSRLHLMVSTNTPEVRQRAATLCTCI